jgi:hypothetical protein
MANPPLVLLPRGETRWFDSVSEQRDSRLPEGVERKVDTLSNIIS